MKFKYQYIVAAAVILIFCLNYADLFAEDAILDHEGTMWYGSVHYLVTSLLHGNFPYWNPDIQCGAYFYPNIPILSGLDPSVLLIVALKALLNVSILKGYFLFYVLRLFLFGAGLYLLYARITRHKLSSALTAGIIVLCIAPQYLRQPGALYAAFLSPFALYFVLRYLERPAGSQGTLFLFSAVLTYGIIVNIYVPAYEAFNTTCFIATLFATGAVRLNAVLGDLKNKQTILSLIAATLVLLLMLGPGLALYRDASSTGELVPIQRIALKTSYGGLKKMMATDLDISSLSQGMSGHTGAFMASGNLACMLTPDANPSLPYFGEHSLFAEMGGYLGIIPLAFALFSIVAVRSRFTWVAITMALLIFVNTFSLHGFVSPFNALQEGFNSIFFPLRMVDARETFDPFLKIYLGMLISMGLGVFLNEPELLRKRLRTFLAICAILICAKITLTGIFSESFLIASTYDGFILGQLFVLAALVFAWKRDLISHAALSIVVIGIILIDLYGYNLFAARHVLRNGAALYGIVAQPQSGGPSGDLQLFREPLPGPPNMAFGENIVGIKGAMTSGVNHSLFSTRRYYDFITHLPLSNQFAMTGILYPIVQFVPIDRVIRIREKNEFLDFYREERPDAGNYLFIETPSVEQPKQQFTSYDQYETVEAILPNNLFRFQDDYLRKNEASMAVIRNNVDRLLHTPDYDVTPTDYTENGITFRVRNAADGYLYYNDSWSKYWEAYDNGKQIPIVIANFAFKAVFLPRGAHEVRFQFNPTPYKAGLAAYATGLICALLTIAFLYFRRRRLSTNVAA